MKLHCSSQAPLVFTGCLDGVVRGWDLRSGQCVKEWHGHSDQILDIVVSRLVQLIIRDVEDLMKYHVAFLLLGMTVPFFQLQTMELFVCF